MLAILVLASSCLASAALIDNGTVLTLNGLPYYAGGIPLGRLDKSSPEYKLQTFTGLDLVPMTIIETSSVELSESELVNTMLHYAEVDDVFQLGFLQTIYVQSTNANHSNISMGSFSSSLSKFNASLVMSAGKSHDEFMGVQVLKGTISGNLPKGPYFMSASTGDIFKAHRIYADDNLAFIQGVISDESDGFLSLTAVTENVMAKSIAVPSRLYYTATDEQPLAGLRFGVKDIYHVKGIATSGGNRAYFYHYGTQNVTAPAIQRLIDLGAVLVGKMGTVQFANGDNPTADWVDLHCPFNARGDGYQDPSGSSTGPGAGMGAYDWLDLAVGTDTGGSMRGPAGSNGVFGGRPSTGAISMDNVIPLSPVSDSAGVFARSASLWAKTTQAWYPNMTSNYTSFPSTIYRSLDPSEWNSSPITQAAQNVVNAFVAKLEGYMQINSTIVDLFTQWDNTHGDAPADLSQMLNMTYAVYISHDQWKLLGKPFFADYAAQNGGRRPFINPGPLVRWTWGQTNADDDVYNDAVRNVSVFRNWYETEGFGRHDPESCSEGLFIYPWTIGEANYRNQYFGAPTSPPIGFGESSASIMAGTPELVVPIGEVPYNSTITLQTEYLPVTMALGMARGCDYVLASLVAELETAGVLPSVVTGKRLYGVSA